MVKLLTYQTHVSIFQLLELQNLQLQIPMLLQQVIKPETDVLTQLVTQEHQQTHQQQLAQSVLTNLLVKQIKNSPTGLFFYTFIDIFYNMMNNNKKGFTLIELLVVIAIIGIISAMVMLIVNPEEQTNKAKDAKVKSSLDSVRVKVGEIFAETTPFGYLNAHNNPTVLKILDSVDNGSIESNEDA